MEIQPPTWWFNLLISSFVGGQEGNELETRLVDHIVQFSLNGVGTGK
jgi:hypothetical protein